MKIAQLQLKNDQGRMILFTIFLESHLVLVIWNVLLLFFSFVDILLSWRFFSHFLRKKEHCIGQSQYSVNVYQHCKVSRQ